MLLECKSIDVFVQRKTISQYKLYLNLGICKYIKIVTLRNIECI